MKKHFIALNILLLFYANIQACPRDSLLTELKNYTKEDTFKINMLLEVGGYYWYRTDMIRKYYNEAYMLSRKLNFKKGIFLGLYVKRFFSSEDLADVNFGEMREIAETDYQKSVIIMMQIGDFNRKNLYDSAFLCYDKLISEYNKKNNEYSLCIGSRIVAKAYLLVGDTLKAIDHMKLADSYAERIEPQSMKDYQNYFNAMSWLNNFNDYGSYTKKFEEVLESLRKMGDKEAELNILRWGGTNANMYKNFSKVLECNYQILELCKESNDSDAIALAYSGLSESYLDLKDYKKSKKFIQKSLTLCRELNDTFSVGYQLNILGNIYLKTDNIDSAFILFSEAQKIGNEIYSNYIRGSSYFGLARVYERRKEYEQAEKFYTDALTYIYKMDYSDRVYFYAGLSDHYYFVKNYTKAKLFADSVFRISKEKKYSDETRTASEILYKIYENEKNCQKAFKYLKLFNDISRKTDANEAKELDLVFEYEKKVKEEEQKQEQLIIEQKNKDELNKQAVDHQKSIRNIFVGAFAVIFLLSILIFRNYRQKQKANTLLKEQKREIEDINEELQIQKEEIEQHNKSMTDSIVYAQRIQSALLPPLTYIDELLHENFIYNKPRDIVSGDFYWVKQVNNYIVIAVADCTGHGVPGAFMSMLGISFLTEIVQRREITQANHILNELRIQIKHSLRQRGQTDESRDGMDMALCVIDTKTKKMQFAGAYNPLYLIKDINDKPELIEYKADRMPAGFFHGKDKSFTNYEIQLEIGDTFYIFSDGFIDQYGGDKEEKFKRKNFKELLLKIHERSLAEQKELLDKALQKWMMGCDQTDDILVMGVRI